MNSTFTIDKPGPYITREGMKARVLTVKDDPKHGIYAEGEILGVGDWTWELNGCDESGDSRYDLVAKGEEDDIG